MVSENHPSNQQAERKKAWQRPDFYFLDRDNVNVNKHLNYAHEAQYSKSVPVGGNFHWYRTGSPHDAGLHGGPLQSLAS